MTDSKQN